MTLPEKQHQLSDRLRLIEDAHERLAAITARGKKWPAPAEDERIDAHRVPGCVSRVWLIGRVEEGVCRWRMDAASGCAMWRIHSAGQNGISSRRFSQLSRQPSPNNIGSAGRAWYAIMTAPHQ